MNDKTQNSDLLSEIEKHKSDFSKGQKLISEYILSNFDKAAFMTASKLGSTVGVSESTVVRFANELGYDGYPKLQASLKELIRSKLTSVQRINVTNEKVLKNGILSGVMLSDIEKIKQTMAENNEEEFESFVEAILHAKKIYILGVRSAAAIAEFMGFYFNLIFDNVRIIHTTSVSDIFEQILNIEKGDIIIGISFPRYSKRTVQALRYAKKKGAGVLALTDSKASPLASAADHLLIARSDMISFVDSLVAPLSIVNAVITSIGEKKYDEISKTFSDLENIWDVYEIYEKK